MTLRRHNLFDSGRATFDANGRAEVMLGPHNAFEHWDINLIVITTTSSLSTSFNLYRQIESPTSLVDSSSHNGNSDVSDSRIHLMPAEHLMGVWEGGTVGAIATMTVSGAATHGGDPAHAIP